jgi:hypothetical protein
LRAHDMLDRSAKLVREATMCDYYQSDHRVFGSATTLEDGSSELLNVCC